MIHARRRSVRRGFTLLEILIVVGILALIAAFAVPGLMKAQSSAKVKLAESAVGNNGIIANALKRYFLDVGKYPDTDEGLEALYKRPNSIDEDSKKWQGPYMENDPEELLDPWQEEYIYESPGKYNEDAFDLSSKGPDMDEGTDDDIKNWKDD